jgi:hypothetical protein
MSRNGTSAIYKSTYYLGIVYMKLATERKLRCNEYRRELETLIPQVHWTSFYCEIAKVLGTVWWLKV